MFLVSLERSWSVDIENGLALTIWTYVAQVMGKRRAGSQIGQFDSRPLKVGNRPLPDLWIESATWRWKDLDEGYNFDLDLVAIRLCSRKLRAFKVSGLQLGQFRDNFGTPTWESREKEPFGCSPRNVAQKILYGGRWWLPRVWAVVCLMVQSARGLSPHPRVSRNVNYPLGWFLLMQIQAWSTELSS